MVFIFLVTVHLVILIIFGFDGLRCGTTLSVTNGNPQLCNPIKADSAVIYSGYSGWEMEVPFQPIVMEFYCTSLFTLLPLMFTV